MQTVLPIPAGLSYEASTALFIQGISAYLLLTDAASGKDKTVLINAGAGGVGSMAVQLARTLGAKQIHRFPIPLVEQ